MKLAEGSTLIGKTIVIRGEISGSEDLFLDGLFEGTVNLPDSRLTIGQNGRITAELHVRDLILSGRLDGNVSATGLVQILATAKVHGSVSAARLSIEENAALHGKVALTGPGAG